MVPACSVPGFHGDSFLPLSQALVSVRLVTGVVKMLEVQQRKRSQGEQALASPDRLCEPRAHTVLPFKPDAILAAEPEFP